MRIVSEFKDFYDCMQASDQDKKTLYIRKTETEDQNTWKWPFPSATSYLRRYNEIQYLDIHTHIVGFCGKIYGIVELQWQNWNDQTGHDYDKTFCNNIEQIKKWCEKHYNKNQMTFFEQGDERLFGGGRKYRKSNMAYMRDHPREGCRRWFEKFFEEVEQKKEKYEKYFNYQTPIFVASHESPDRFWISRNGNLKKVEFFRIFSPALAYQELTMYLYNMAVPMKPIPVFDDVTMAESKGFNRFSFRKDPIRKRK